jgi:hypothetical protein
VFQLHQGLSCGGKIRIYLTTGRRSVVLNKEFQEAKKIARRIAASIGSPRFYIERKRAVEASRRLYRSALPVRDCLRLVEDRCARIGHGSNHVRKVAIDAGAVIIIEKALICSRSELNRLVLMAHMAGLLHDIRRLEKNHARAGAEEAEELLSRFDLEGREVMAITSAIANHEAFRAPQPLEDPVAQTLSDAVYDADKFRWGPDNFTEMLWDMVEYRKSSFSVVLERFLPGMEGIREIKNTFRTSTGKIYGPDFIERGLEIGERLYFELVEKRRGNEKEVIW